MGELDEELIQKVASTARIHLSADEIASFQQEFSEVLELFSVLDQKEIPAQAPKTIHPITDTKQQFREDVVSDSLSQKQALQFTDDSEDGFFIGPKAT